MNEILSLIRQTALEFPSIRRVLLFGSPARGDFSDGSDYDIAIFGADENTVANFTNRIDELPTLYKIDVVFVNDKLVGKPIYNSIMKDGVVIMDKFIGKLENYKKAVLRLEEGINEAEENKSMHCATALFSDLNLQRSLRGKAQGNIFYRKAKRI